MTRNWLEHVKENVKNPSMHDAVMVGVITNTFLVLALAVILFLVANTAAVGARPDATKVEDSNTLFVGHPASQEAGCSIKCGDLPTTSSRRLYSFYAQGPDGTIDILLDYGSRRISFDPCLTGSNIDIYLYNETGHRIDNGEMATCEAGEEGYVYENGISSGIYTVEVVGTHGGAIEYDIEVIAS